MESPPCNLIELLMCMFLYWTLYICHFCPFLTIFDQFGNFNHYRPFFTMFGSFETSQNLPKTCTKLAENFPQTCLTLAFRGPVIFDIMDHHNISFLICMSFCKLTSKNVCVSRTQSCLEDVDSSWLEIWQIESSLLSNLKSWLKVQKTQSFLENNDVSWLEFWRITSSLIANFTSSINIICHSWVEFKFSAP